MIIKLEVIMENTKLAELGIQQDIFVDMRIRKDQIEAYRHFVDTEGEISLTQTLIYTINGGIYTVNISLEELDKLLEDVS